MAICAGVLEGAPPVRRIKGLDENGWACLFVRQGTSVPPIWGAAAQKPVSTRVGESGSIERIGITGHLSNVAVHGGALDLPIKGSPHYLVGLSAARLR